MIPLIVVAVIALVAVLVLAELAARLVAVERRARERDQARYEAREREWYEERTALLDRLHMALGKPWGAPPPVETRRPEREEYEVLTSPPAIDPGLAVVQVPEEMLG